MIQNQLISLFITTHYGEYANTSLNRNMLPLQTEEDKKKALSVFYILLIIFQMWRILK